MAGFRYINEIFPRFCMFTNYHVQIQIMNSSKQYHSHIIPDSSALWESSLHPPSHDHPPARCLQRPILNSCFKTAGPTCPAASITTLPRLLLSTGQLVSDTVIMMVTCVTVAAAAAAAPQHWQLGNLKACGLCCQQRQLELNLKLSLGRELARPRAAAQ